MLQEPQTTLNPQCSFKRQTWLECVTVTEGAEGAAHNGSIVLGAAQIPPGAPHPVWGSLLK